MSRKNSVLGLTESEKAEFLDIFYTYEHLKFHAQLVEHEIFFYNLGPRCPNNKLNFCIFRNPVPQVMTFLHSQISYYIRRRGLKCAKLFRKFRFIRL